MVRLILLALLLCTPAYAQQISPGGGGSSGGGGATSCSGARQVTTGATDTALTTDCVVGWKSSTASAKAETLFGCSSSYSGKIITFKDEQGTAGTYSILINAASGTIDFLTSASIGVNKAALSLQCDGVNNWMVI